MGSINKFIKILITSDFFLNYGLGLLGPIFSIFIIKNVTAGDMTEAAKVAGIATLLYWVPKSIIQIPVGRFVDKNHGETDDFWFMIGGLFLTALVPFGYLFSFLPWHIYVLQTIHGIGMAMSLPPWLALFTKRIDKGKEGLEWGVESTFLGLGAGIGGAAGGYLASIFGFSPVFIMAGCFNLFAVSILLLLHKKITRENFKAPAIFPIEHPY
jgi:MFS family permease